MEQNKNSMPISELSNMSGIPVSTIKFYIRKGLLYKPEKTRGTKAYYNSKHLNRLKLIKKIQQEGSMPLDKILEVISMIDENENSDVPNKTISSSDIKAEIIKAAISVFRSKGYEKATIADLVDAARIGRSTFYKHFQNKQDLFIACIKKIIFSEMKKFDMQDIQDEMDIIEVFDKYAKAYYNVNPLWIEMGNLLRAAAINDPDEFADKLEEVTHLKIDRLKRGLENGIKNGLFRQINATLMACMILGMQDYANYISKDQKGKTFVQLYEEGKDIILYGILNK